MFPDVEEVTEMTEYLKLLLMPLPYFMLAAVLAALSKAPLPDHAVSWLVALAGVSTSLGSILLNPEHLMTLASVSKKPPS
jgi:hypothetical protein